MGCGASSAALRRERGNAPCSPTLPAVTSSPVGEGTYEKSINALPVLHEDRADDSLRAPFARETVDDNASVCSSSVRSGRTTVSSTFAPHGVIRFSSKSDGRARGGGGPDDLMSDVPTISESIADMQDLAELGRTDSHLLGAEHRSNHFHSTWSTQTTVIDHRPHPLAPAFSSNATEAGLTSDSRDLCVGDLGVCSDIPSVCDAMSTHSSATSEIVVTFPSSFPGAASTSSPPASEVGRTDSGGRGVALQNSMRRQGSNAGSSSSRGSRRNKVGSSRHVRPGGSGNGGPLPGV